MFASAAAGRAARRRRAIARTGSVRNAVAMRRPAGSRTISSHRGRPPTVSIGADRGCRRPVVGLDGTADAWADALAGGCAAADGAPTAGAVAGTDAGVPVDVALGRDTGGDVNDVGCDARDAECGIASTVPARIASGLGPISCPLA